MEQFRRLRAAVLSGVPVTFAPRKTHGCKSAVALARAWAPTVEQLEVRTLLTATFTAFVASPQSGTVPAQVTMNFVTTGGIATSWCVNFGDPNSPGSVTFNGSGGQITQCTHTYTTADTQGYTVTAQATEVGTLTTATASFALSSAFGSNYPSGQGDNGVALYTVPGNTGYGGGYQVAVDSSGKAYVISKDNGLMAITRFNNGVLDQTWGPSTSPGTLTIAGFDGGGDTPFCTYIRNQFLAVAGTGRNGIAVALINTQTQLPMWAIPATGSPAISAGQANGVVIDNNNDVIVAGTNGTNMVAVKIIGTGASEGQLASWGDNGSGIKTITWTGGTGSGANAIIQPGSGSDYLVGGWKSYCYAGPGGGSCTACVMAVVALDPSSGSIDANVLGGGATAPNFGCVAAGGHPINGCSGTGYPSNDAVYSIVDPSITGFNDPDVWVVGSSTYPGTNQFAYADFNKPNGAMSPDGVANLGIWAGPAGVAYGAVVYANPQPPAGDNQDFLVAAGTGTGAGGGNDFVFQRYVETVDGSGIETPLAIDTSFGIGGTFDLDLGTTTANTTDGAMGLTINPSNNDLIASGFSTSGLSGGASGIAVVDLLSNPAFVVNAAPSPPPVLAAAQPLSTATTSAMRPTRHRPQAPTCCSAASAGSHCRGFRKGKGSGSVKKRAAPSRLRRRSCLRCIAPC